MGLIFASISWAIHFFVTGLRLKVYGDYGVVMGFFTVSMVIWIHMTSLTTVKLGVMFGGGFVLAGVSKIIQWTTHMNETLDPSSFPLNKWIEGKKTSYENDEFFKPLWRHECIKVWKTDIGTLFLVEKSLICLMWGIFVYSY